MEDNNEKKIINIEESTEAQKQQKLTLKEKVLTFLATGAVIAIAGIGATSYETREDVSANAATETVSENEYDNLGVMKYYIYQQYTRADVNSKWVPTDTTYKTTDKKTVEQTDELTKYVLVKEEYYSLIGNEPLVPELLVYQIETRENSNSEWIKGDLVYFKSSEPPVGEENIRYIFVGCMLGEQTTIYEKETRQDENSEWVPTGEYVVSPIAPVGEVNTRYILHCSFNNSDILGEEEERSK